MCRLLSWRLEPWPSWDAHVQPKKFQGWAHAQKIFLLAVCEVETSSVAAVKARQKIFFGTASPYLMTESSISGATWIHSFGINPCVPNDEALEFASKKNTFGAESHPARLRASPKFFRGSETAPRKNLGDEPLPLNRNDTQFELFFPPPRLTPFD